jgi:hypothetical protein
VDDLTMWSLVVGALLPVLVAVVQQARWPDWLRAVVTAVSCLVAGAVTAWLAGDMTGKTFVSSVLTVLVTALATYQGFWKRTGVAPAVERVTSRQAYVKPRLAPAPEHEQ